MDLNFDDAATLASEIAQGRLDPRDLMSATYDQIEAVNPQINALVSLLPRDEAVHRAGQHREGPLAGLPLAVKDLANIAGFPTSMGSPVFADRGPMKTTDIAIARLVTAGAVVIGKSNTPEFGLGSHTTNPVHGATGNPYDPSRSTGGSSGGASAALATGMVSLADGSDMMGSLRNPAGWTNTYGLRPSWGLVPSEPVGDTFLHQLATNGPLGRSPADIELMLRVMAGPDARQPHGRVLEASTPPKRLLWLGDCGLPFEPGVLETCRAALPLFDELGCEVSEAQTPVFAREALWDAWITLRSWQVAASLAPLMSDPAMRSKLKPEAIWEAERGLALSAMDIHRASVARSQWFATCAQLFTDYDALLLPTAQVWPFPVDQAWPHEIAGAKMDIYHRWMEVTVPASLIGLPAMAVPAGFSVEGLPMGLQIIGPRGADLGLIAMAKRWHETASWVSRRPAICG